MKSICLSLLFLLFFLPSSCQGAKNQIEKVRSVPLLTTQKWLESTNPLSSQLVELSKAEYTDLLNKKNEDLSRKRELTTARDSLSHSFRSVSIEAQEKEDKLHIEQTIELVVTCSPKYSGPITVPLSLQDLAVTKIEVSSPSAPLKVLCPFGSSKPKQYIELSKPGVHLVKVVGESPIKRLQSKCSCKMPLVNSMVQQINLKFNSNKRLRVYSDEGIITQRNHDSQNTFRLNCSGQSVVAVTWSPLIGKKPTIVPPPRLITTMSSSFKLNVGDISTNHRVRLVNTGGPTRSVSFYLPFGTTVDGVAGKDIKHHFSTVATRGRVLSVLFKRPVTGATEFDVDCSREGLSATDPKQILTLYVPYVVSAARKQGSVKVTTPFSATISATNLSPIYRQQSNNNGIELRYHSSHSSLPTITIEVNREARLISLGAWAANSNSITVLSHSHSTDNGVSRSLSAVTKVVLQVVNPSEDFLTFELPTKAELYECLVDGAASTPTILKSTEAAKLYRLRLLKSLSFKGRLLTYSITLTYRMMIGTPLQSYGHFQCNQPRFSIPIANLAWEVVLPEGHTVTDTEGPAIHSKKDVDFFPISSMNAIGAYFSDIGEMNQARKERCKQNIDVFRNAINLHNAQNAPLVGTSLEPLLGRYLQELPRCPFGATYRLNERGMCYCPHCTKDPMYLDRASFARVGETIQASTGKKITFKTDSFRMPRTGQSLFFSRSYVLPQQTTSFKAYQIAYWLVLIYGVSALLLGALVLYIISRYLPMRPLSFFIAGGLSLFLIIGSFLDEVDPNVCKCFFLGGLLYLLALHGLKRLQRRWLGVFIILGCSITSVQGKTLTLHPLHLPHCKETASSYFVSYDQWETLTKTSPIPEPIQPIEGVSTGTCEVTIHKNYSHIELEAKMQLSAKNERELVLSNNIGKVSICSAYVDNSPIDLRIGYDRRLFWKTSLTGLHTFKLNLDVPHEKKGRDNFSLQIPVIQSAIGILKLKLNEPFPEGVWSLENGLLEKVSSKSYTAHYPPSDMLVLNWRNTGTSTENEINRDDEAPPDVTFVHQVNILNEEYTHDLALLLKKIPEKNRLISLLIPKGVDVIGVDAPFTSIDWHQDRVIFHLSHRYSEREAIVVKLSSRTDNDKMDVLLPTVEKCRKEEHFIAVAITDGLKAKLTKVSPDLRKIRASKIPENPLNFGTRTFSHCLTSCTRRNSPQHSKQFTKLTFEFNSLESAKTWIGMSRLVEATTFISATGDEVTRIDYYFNDWQWPYIALRTPNECQIISVLQDEKDVSDVFAKDLKDKNEILLPVDQSSAKRTSLTYLRTGKTFRIGDKTTLALPATNFAIANLRWTIYTPNEFGLQRDEGTIRVDSSFRTIGLRNKPSELGLGVSQNSGMNATYLSTELVGPQDLPPTISFSVVPAQPKRSYRKLYFIVAFIALLALLLYPQNWRSTSILSLIAIIASFGLFWDSPSDSLYRGIYLAFMCAPVVATALSLLDFEETSEEPSRAEGRVFCRCIEADA